MRTYITANANPFRIRTYGNKDLKSFRMRTYKNMRGWGCLCRSPSDMSTTLLVPVRTYRRSLLYEDILYVPSVLLYSTSGAGLQPASEALRGILRHLRAGLVQSRRHLRRSVPSQYQRNRPRPPGISLAYGLTFGAMVVAVGRVSGGHINPAVTIAYWVTHRLGTFDTLLYWAAQLGDVILAAYLLRYVVPEDTWRAVALGTPELASGVTRLPGMLIEGVITFFLIFVMFAIGLDEYGIPRPVAGFAGGPDRYGLVVSRRAFHRRAINPARALGPALVANHWSNYGVYWIGPLAGGVIAAWISDLIFLGTPKKMTMTDATSYTA